MLEIKKVYRDSDLYSAVIELLINDYDFKNRGRDYWVSRYESSALDYIGYSLIIGGKVTGFLGVIGGGSIVGMSVWFVKPDFRRHSIKFLVGVLELIDEPVINSSPNPVALKLFKKLGFSHNLEFIGIPRKLFGFKKRKNYQIYAGSKLGVVVGQISIIELLFLSISNKKIYLKLHDKPEVFLFSKKVNVLSRGMSYSFPMSLYGDIYE